MRILGIDPAVKITGYGLIDIEDNKIKLVEAGIIEPKARDLIQNKIAKIYRMVDGIIKQHNPDVMVLEKLYAHYHHPVTACILGHVRGVICLLCAQHDIKLVEHSVRRIRKSIVGRGEASKLQTQRMVAHILNVKQEQLTFDASDALALALGYANFFDKRV